MLCFVCYAEGTLLLCHFGLPHSLIRSGESRNSNHSRTSEKFSRKSNYSRTYAKTGGGGGVSCKMSSLITLLFSSAVLTMKLSTIVGAPTFPFLRARKDRPKNRSRKAGSATTKPREKRPPPRPGRGRRQAAATNPRERRPLQKAASTEHRKREQLESRGGLVP